MFFYGVDGGGQLSGPQFKGPIVFAPKTLRSYKFGRLFTRHPVGAGKCKVKGCRPANRAGFCSRCGERVEAA